YSMLPPPPRSTLLPYTTLFRSGLLGHGDLLVEELLELLTRLVGVGPAVALQGVGPGGGVPQLGDELLQLRGLRVGDAGRRDHPRSEEHTSELQSRENLVCRLLL